MSLSAEELADLYVSENWAKFDDGDAAFRNCFIDMLFLVCQVAVDVNEFDFADDIGLLIDVALMK